MSRFLVFFTTVLAITVSQSASAQQIIVHTRPVQTVQTSTQMEYVPQTRTTYKAVWNCDHYDMLPSTTTDYQAVRRTTTQYGPVQQVPTAVSIVQPVVRTVAVPVTAVPVVPTTYAVPISRAPVAIPTRPVRRILGGPRALLY
jgi:hypothetical protein